MGGLRELLDALPENERRVLEYRYELKKTLEATGEAMGISKTRVTQIEAVAMRRLKKRLNHEP